MDLLQTEYHDPFAMLNGVIRMRKLMDFVDFFIDKHNERFRWRFWLHHGQYVDMTWDEFNRRLDGGRIVPENINSTKEETAETINASFSLMQSFNPEEGGPNGSI